MTITKAKETISSTTVNPLLFRILLMIHHLPETPSDAYVPS